MSERAALGNAALSLLTYLLTYLSFFIFILFLLLFLFLLLLLPLLLLLLLLLLLFGCSYQKPIGEILRFFFYDDEVFGKIFVYVFVQDAAADIGDDAYICLIELFFQTDREKVVRIGKVGGILKESRAKGIMSGIGV